VLTADVEVDRRDFTVRASLTVAAGERVALFGPSGAGKTTVLETIAGLVWPRRGLVELGGRVLTSTGSPAVEVPPWQRRVGLLRQDPGLFPHLPVRANLLYARSAAGAELTTIARQLGIDELLPVMPARLSGGQRHRVALGRLLLAHCDALLLDEPFASLDETLRRALTVLVKDLSSEREVPSVLVTHQLSDAQAFADRLLVMDQGFVLQAGAPDEVVLRPASRRVAELVGYLGFVPAAADGGGHGSAGSPAGSGTAGSAGPGAGVVAGVHPDRVMPGADPSRGLVVTGTVEAARPSGAGWEADLRSGDASFTCRLPDRPDSAQVSVTLLDPPLFAPDGSLIPAAAGVLPPARSG
jgi:molybdate transport system ATP-binding protein